MADIGPAGQKVHSLRLALLDATKELVRQDIVISAAEYVRDAYLIRHVDDAHLDNAIEQLDSALASLAAAKTVNV